MPNRLADETSPYLLQHKDNPVEWYPWGAEAFAKARDEDKPILLSVGYSSCHWCHVMAHESFEDEATAALMNQWFVNVKVDREERPDVDGVYMTAVQAITGQGGWPMTVFLAPDGRPFYAGTYFPPSDGHGRPGFPRVLEALHDAWTTERDKLIASAEGITDHLKRAASRVPGAARLPDDAADRAVDAFRSLHDPQWGGFGGPPKFPSPSNLEFLLAYAAAHKGEPRAQAALEMTLHTLRKMAEGGMYDHLGGGFSRYSVDTMWLVPHFEKMLYDNAQLVRVYLHAYQLTHDPLFEHIVRETLTYLQREMRGPEGGFYSAQDADTEGIEGKYFVWTVPEVEAVLGEDAPLFLAYYNVTTEGNFEDPHHPEFGRRNVLSTPRPIEEVAGELGIEDVEAEARLVGMREKMLAVRELRAKPGLDDKGLASWNGLALAAFAEAARVLGDEQYRAVAEQNAVFLMAKFWDGARLRHTYKKGKAKVDGLLEDYAYVGLGLVELYKLDGQLAHLDWARALLDIILERFRDPETGGFFESPEDGEALIIRQKSFFDAATPSGNGATALLALWLGRYYNRADYEAVAPEVLRQVSDHLLQAVTGFGTILQVLEFAASPPRELVIVGQPAARAPLEREAAQRFLPWLALAPTADGRGLPMFAGREKAPARAARAYLCENMV
ncbi:MAG: thioredoxin domain-containing protein, partial [Tepidiformaceae bacterium]